MKRILTFKVFILLIPFILPCALTAQEKPEIFVQMAKESIIYFSSLKFTLEVQT